MDRGHTVRVAGYDTQVRPFRALGLDVTVLARGGTKPTGSDPLRAVFEGVFVNADHVDDVADELAAFAPDVVVVDCMLFGALAGAYASGVPTAALIHSAPRALAEGPGMERLLPQINALRAGLALPAVDEVLGAWTDGAALATSLPALDGRTPSVGVTYLGPLADQRSGVWQSPWTGGDDRSLILASLSTGRVFGDQTPRYQRIADGLADLPLRLLITTGGAVDPADLQLPANAHAVSFAPHREILLQAAACILHAGHGTLCAALGNGVPLVCLPNPAADQPHLARRIDALGAGIHLQRDASPTEIGAAVTRLLDDRGFREAAKRLATMMQDAPGIDGAAVALHALTGANAA